MTKQVVPDGAVIAPGSMLVGKYRVVRSIGRGGMAQVYEALQLGLGKRVAVKVLNAQYSASPILTERFFREARAASAVKSPYIVDVYDSGRLDDQRPFIVMELLDGESLYERLARKRRLTPAEVVAIAAHCAKGLAKAHAAGIVHRDLKPENIFLVQSEEGAEVAKILDFGLAKFYAATDDDEAVQRLTRDGAVFGTPPYMSPEQVRGQAGVDHRTDLWALGCIVYEALVGKPVWRTDQGVAMIFAAIASGDLPRPSVEHEELPSSFDRWFRKALARKPEDRFQAASEFSDALRDAFTKEAIVRAAAESTARIESKRLDSLRPPPLAVPPAPALEVRALPNAGAQTIPSASPPEGARTRRSEPPAYVLEDRRRNSMIRVGVGVLAVGVAGTIGGLMLAARDDARASVAAVPAAPDSSAASSETPSDSVAPTPAPVIRGPVVSGAVRDLVATKRYAEAAQEVVKGTAGASARWLADVWRRTSAVDLAACAPAGWGVFAGDPLVEVGEAHPRTFVLSGPRGAEHLVSQGLSAEGWLLDEPTADATPEGAHILAARVVPVGDRFAAFVVEGAEDEKVVRLRARALGSDGAPLGASVVVAHLQGYRHLSEVRLTASGDAYVVAFGTVSPAGIETLQVLRIEPSFEAKGKPTVFAQAGAASGIDFGAPHLGLVGGGVVVAYTVTAGGRRFGETQLIANSAPQWGSEGFGSAVEAKGSRRLALASRVAERVAPGSELALACGAARCFLGWDDDARGAYVARLDTVTGALHVATSLGKGGGRMLLAPLPEVPEGVQIAWNQGGAVRSLVVDSLGAHPGPVLVRSAGSPAAFRITPGGARVLVAEGEGSGRHGIVVTAQCR